MLFIKKLWVLLKHYWYIPFLGAVALFLYFVSRDSNLVDWKRVLKDANESHRKEIAAIDKANEAQVAAINIAVKRAQEAEAQIRAEFEKNERQLDVAKEKRVKKILKDFRDDPNALVDELEKETGYRVIILQ